MIRAKVSAVIPDKENAEAALDTTVQWGPWGKTYNPPPRQAATTPPMIRPKVIEFG